MNLTNLTQLKVFLGQVWAATLRLISDHEARLQLRKGRLGASPSPSCQHSLWEETTKKSEYLQKSCSLLQILSLHKIV